MKREASDESAALAARRTELEKVLSSRSFARASQLRALLDYLGQRSMAGSGEKITEKEIAEKVLRRPNFNPETDSLVRKEMSRLRDKLSRYYLSEGAANPLRLDPNDGYSIAFRHAETEPNSPIWLILPFRSPPGLAESAEEIFDDLHVSVYRSRAADLISPATALTYRLRPADVRHFAAECGADYVVEGSLRLRDGHFEITAWFIEAASGRCVRSFRTSGSAPAELSKAASDWLLNA